jgi:2-dehydropantoate 2-reductase
VANVVRFTVVGAGAIGGTLGAYLARAGEQVEFADRAEDHVAAMNAKGLTIKAFDGRFTIPVSARRLDELKGPLDVVLLAVKAQDTESAVRSIIPLLDAGSAVVSLQNGLCEPVIANLIGASRTIGAFINYDADYLEPGVIHYAGPGAFFVGEIDGSSSARVEEIVLRLGHWGTVRATTNIFGYLWAKLGYANMLYATALVDSPMADVIDAHRPLMVELACEVYEAAVAEGIHLEPFDSVEPDLYYPRESQDWKAINHSLDSRVLSMRKSEKPKSGIWRDLAVRKRKTEVDYHLGVVATAGGRHGLRMPLTHGVIGMIHEIEESKRVMSRENIAELEALYERQRG